MVSMWDPTHTDSLIKQQHNPQGKNILSDLRSVWPCFELASLFQFTNTPPHAKAVRATQLCGPNTGNRLLLPAHESWVRNGGNCWFKEMSAVLCRAAVRAERIAWFSITFITHTQNRHIFTRLCIHYFVIQNL